MSSARDFVNHRYNLRSDALSNTRQANAELHRANGVRALCIPLRGYRLSSEDKEGLFLIATDAAAQIANAAHGFLIIDIKAILVHLDLIMPVKLPQAVSESRTFNDSNRQLR